MTTISVPLTAIQIEAIEELIKQGRATTKAGAVRQALDRYIEEQAVLSVLEANREPTLRGNLDRLADAL